MSKDFEISERIPASPEAIYKAWLDSDRHSRMTGSPAQASAEVGGVFIVWDGYISGKNLALEPGRRILQAWRTSDFADSDPDSLLEVRLKPEQGGTRVVLRHSNLPAGGDGYLQGWIDFYFTPMKV